MPLLQILSYNSVRVSFLFLFFFLPRKPKMKSSTLFEAVAAVSAFAVMAGSGALLAKSFGSTTEIRDYVQGLVMDALRYCSTNMTMVIGDFSGVLPNNLFEDANVYMSTRISPFNTSRFAIFIHENDTDRTLYLVKDAVFTSSSVGSSATAKLIVT